MLGLLRLPVTFIVYFPLYTFIVKQKCINCGKTDEGAALQSPSEEAGNPDGMAAALHRNPTPCSSPVLPLPALLFCLHLFRLDQLILPELCRGSGPLMLAFLFLHLTAENEDFFTGSQNI